MRSFTVSLVNNMKCEYQILSTGTGMVSIHQVEEGKREFERLLCFRISVSWLESNFDEGVILINIILDIG